MNTLGCFNYFNERYIMKTIDERIAELEKDLTVPGTQITRILNEEGKGLQWCLSIGVMRCPKIFFHGETIDEAITQAEIYFKIKS
jgi:hypothetical protein